MEKTDSFRVGFFIPIPPWVVGLERSGKERGEGGGIFSHSSRKKYPRKEQNTNVKVRFS